MLKQLFTAARGEPIIAGLAIVLRSTPEGCDPAAVFEPVQRGIKRAMFYLENFFGTLLDDLSDGVAVCRTEDESLEDEEVESALEHLAIERMCLANRHGVLVSIP